MRWPRFLRRRPKPPAWLTEAAPTFHTEQRTVATHDGPMTIAVPVLDQPFDAWAPTPGTRDLRVIQCNYAVGTKICAEGARAYVMQTNPGGGADRIHILARSRGGRFVDKWEDIRRLRDFRPKVIPPEHPLHGHLWTGYTDAAETAAHLEKMRQYWSTHTGSGAPLEAS